MTADRHLSLVPDPEPYRLTPVGFLTDQEIADAAGCTCGHQGLCRHCCQTIAETLRTLGDAS